MAFEKNFQVRWSEIDLNMHLTSSAYVKYITDTRMSFFVDNGFGLAEMAKHQLGPIVLWEKSYYFKEVHPDQKFTVKIKNDGESENGGMMRLEQRIYNEKGENCFLAYTLIAFLDLRLRKMIAPPEALAKVLASLPKSENYKIIPKEDLRDADAKAR